MTTQYTDQAGDFARVRNEYVLGPEAYNRQGADRSREDVLSRQRTNDVELMLRDFVRQGFVPSRAAKYLLQHRDGREWLPCRRRWRRSFIVEMERDRVGRNRLTLVDTYPAHNTTKMVTR